MRIISGSAKGKKLAAFTGSGIRPTGDRVREALFSMLYSRLGDFTGLSVLDLYAGSGALALEALSRGANHAVLVDSCRQAADLIERNARTCQLNKQISLIRGTVLDQLPRLRDRAPFDLIFLDPPYHQNLLHPTLEAISDLNLLAEGGIVCIDTSSKETVPEKVGRLLRIAQRRYGASRIGLLTLSPCEDLPK